MKTDYVIDLNERDGIYKFNLIEALECLFDYFIIEDSAYLMVTEENLKQVKKWPIIANDFLEMVAGAKKVTIRIRNFKAAYDHAIEFVLFKQKLDEEMECMITVFEKELDQIRY